MVMMGVELWQPAGGFAAQVVWLGLRVNGAWRHSTFISNEPGEPQWFCHDDSSINIGIIIIIVIITFLLLHAPYL